MKSVFLFMCFLWANILHAQNKELDKIQKQFVSGKYAKVIKLCDKSLSEINNKKIPDYYYYKALSVLKSGDSSSATFYKTITSSLSIASKGSAFDKNNLLFFSQNVLFKELLDASHRQAEIKYYTNKIKEAKYIESTIARSFKDTSDLYLVLFSVPKQNLSNVDSVSYVLKSNANKLDSILYFATTQLGKVYKYGKEGPDSFDCSGFIGYVFKSYGEKLPHNANLISKLGEEVKIENVQKGDLIFFGHTSAYHVAMYIAESGEPPKIIHCVSRGVCIDDLSTSSHWGQSNIYKIKRILK